MQEGLLSTVAWTIDGRTDYALEGSIFITGAALNWLRDGLGVIDDFAEAEPLATSVPDTDGVVFVPAFVGLGSPYWDPYARGTIVGLTRGTTKAHLVRAAIEAMAHQSQDVHRSDGRAPAGAADRAPRGRRRRAHGPAVSDAEPTSRASRCCVRSCARRRRSARRSSPGSPKACGTVSRRSSVLGARPSLRAARSSRTTGRDAAQSRDFGAAPSSASRDWEQARASGRDRRVARLAVFACRRTRPGTSWPDSADLVHQRRRRTSAAPADRRRPRSCVMPHRLAEPHRDVAAPARKLRVLRHDLARPDQTDGDRPGCRPGRHARDAGLAAVQTSVRRTGSLRVDAEQPVPAENAAVRRRARPAPSRSPGAARGSVRRGRRTTASSTSPSTRPSRDRSRGAG